MNSSGIVPSEPHDQADFTHQVAVIVHDLCQPLTTLQCRLELAQIVDTSEDYRNAVALGVAECARMSRHVHALREVLRALARAVPDDRTPELLPYAEPSPGGAKN